MKTRPINTAVLVTLALGACVWLAVATAQGGDPASDVDVDVTAIVEAVADDVGAVDPRLIAAMEQTDLAYEIDEDNDVKVIFAWDDNRSHAVWANTVTEEYEGMDIREVWGIVAQFDSPDDVSKDVLLDLLVANFQLKFGKYAILMAEDGGQVQVRFVVTVPADADGATLATIMDFVGVWADEKEKELEEVSGSDIF